MYKNYLIISIFLLLNGSILAQNTKSSPLFSCTELMKTIKNKADRTKINFNGNIKDFANDMFASIIMPGMKEYLENLYSTANRDVSQEEREIIAAQAIECGKKINWDFNNTNSKKKESYDKDDSQYFDFAMNILGQFLRSNSSQNSSVFGNSNGSPKSNSNSSSVCTYCKPYETKGHYIKDYDSYNKTFQNGRYILRPGYKPCSSCHGTGNCKAYNTCSSSQESSRNYTCQICSGDRFQLCSNCKGSGKR
jgi:hypothetical protein